MRVRLAVVVPVLLAVFLILLPGAGRAQGIDCSRARSATEKAICASPALLALDHQVAVAYADALARQPERRDALRTELLAWLRSRDAACTVPAGGLERCLSGQLTARLAALAPPPAGKPAEAAASPPSPPAGPAPPAGLVPLQTAAATRPPDPAIPTDFERPQAAATLDAGSLPAAAEADTLLHVTAPGRFTLAAHSRSGAALQLVDMLTGPSDTMGVAGAQDGRLDTLLDVGTYKLRVFSAQAATGPVRLSATPFHDAAPPAALPSADWPLAATLKDGEQRAFWLLVPPGDGPNVRIEAAGRSLADLRLWRDGRELAALDPSITTVEPVPGHRMTDARLAGHVEPGTYLAVAYGGPSLAWTDNDASQPFHLRGGLRTALAEGWAGGTMGPFGSELYELPSFARILRLDLAAAAAAELRNGDAVATIAKNNREPSATLSVPAGRPAVVEVRAAAGQAFTVRAIDFSTQTSWNRPGTWWVSAEAVGMGADEVPPTFLLARYEGLDKPARILGTNAPVIGQGAPYRARFNLRGPTDLLVQTPNGGDVAFSSTGVDIRHGRNGRGSLPPGFYLMDLEPKPGAIGSIEVTIGTPGAAPAPLAVPLPPDPVIPLGIQTVAPGQSLRLAGGDAPDATLGLRLRPVPVPLAEGPLIATVAAGGSLSVPVAVAPGGTLSVTELGVGPIAAGQIDNTQPGRTTVVIPVSDKPRTVALAWHRTEARAPAIPAPGLPSQVATVAAGTPSFFDLARGEERGFALTVPEGGLFRLETLGRLHTSGRLATPFIPRLATADGNGTGQNLLIQSALRAGRYRVDVKAVDSAGHLGLLASPAPLPEGGTLVPGGSVRASLRAGSGVAFPVEVTGADGGGKPDARYRFDVLSLGAPWTGRLEDAEGWPLVTPGPLDGTEVALRPGRYRLVVTPDAVGRQVVARLVALAKPAEITGHGPHALPFEAPQTATWREPDGRDQPRTPDTWIFALAGPAEVTVTLGDGMVGELRRAGSDGTVAKVVKSWTGTLEAGDYQLLATSLGRNDRLGYTVGVTSPALQPGTPRDVTLPASVPFSLAAPRVASLTSWGTVPVKAVLRQEDGAVVARYNSRADDWNIAASRLLPAGRYVLELQSSAPPSVSGGSGVADSAGSGDQDAPEDDDQAAQTDATQGAAVPAKGSAAAPASDDADSSAPGAASGDAAEQTVSVRLALPPALPASDAPAQAAELSGVGVHVLTLPQPGSGQLVVAAARSSAAMVLALERQVGDGWQTVALASGRSAVAAAPADGGPAGWRVEAWTVDGGTEPIRLAARAVDAAAQAGGSEPVRIEAVEGMPVPVAVARASLPGAGLAALGAVPGLLAGGWPGHSLLPARSAAAAATPELWLLAPRVGTVAVRPFGFTAGEPVAVEIPPGLPLVLPAADGLAVWRVTSGAGQPNLGLDGSLGGGDAVALAAHPVPVGGTDRPSITRFEPKLLPVVTAGSAVRTTVPSNSALPLRLPEGDKALHVDLGPGLAVFAGWHDPAPFAVAAGGGQLTETLAGTWTELLVVNTGASPGAATVLTEAAAEIGPLTRGTVRKRFFGAPGSFAFGFDAPAGSRVMTAGAVTAKAVVTAAGATDGEVAGQGRAWIAHGAGPVAVWLDAPGVAAWPAPAPREVGLPLNEALSGPAVALRFQSPGPALLHVASTAPVLAGLRQGDGAATPEMFATGAELHRVVAAGPATLLLVSPDDGPLGGTVSVWAEALRPVGEGLGETVAVGPGGTAAFAFTLPKQLTIGVGVRAEPDMAEARLMDAHGAVVGEGVAQLRTLPAGDYVLEVRVTGPGPALLRPALVGITPRGDGPPPDVVQSYLELAGMKPQRAP